MTSVSYPGVYVEEIPGGARPIEAASTSTAAFVGVTEKGPDGVVLPDEDRAHRITGWQEFQNKYGGFFDGGLLAESVYQFFNNGGRQCYIVRVIGSGAQAASVTIPNRAGTNGIKISANSSGVWGNALYINIEDGQEDSGNTFTLSVYDQIDPESIPTLEIAQAATPIEVHENLSMDEASTNYFKTRIEEDSEYIFAEFDEANNVVLDNGYHLGGADPDTSIGAGLKFQININGDGYQEVTLAANSTLETIRGDIESKVSALDKKKNTTLDAAFDNFVCTIEWDPNTLTSTSGNITVTSLTDDKVVEVVHADGDPFTLTFEGNIASISGTATTTDIVNALGELPGAPVFEVAGDGDPWTLTLQRPHLKLVSGTSAPNSSVLVRAATTNDVTELLQLGAHGVSFGGLSRRRPAIPDPGALYQIGDHPTNSVAGVDDTASLTTPTSYKEAFEHLNKITDVSLLAVPGVPGMFDAGVEYCENRPLRDIFFIGETDDTDDSPADAETFRKNINKPNTYGSIFFPWIRSPDPSGRQAEPILLPPSGFMAGLFARIDTTRGVWKAPAGTEASVSGAAGLLVELTDIQQGNLNKIGVNCLRRFPLAGIVSWGARTVYSDPEYKYVPVRRTAIMLRRSIYDGIQWAVFEPNDHRLWASLRLNIGSFMNGLFRAAAFQGEKASDAYFVRCGLGDTMTQGDIDRGQVIVLIGFAALKPAEFVIVRIQQKAGQTQ